jgi:predicted metal-dependent hydrolase
MIKVGTVEYGGDTIRYEMWFLGSRRTLSIQVHPDMRVLVLAPVGCPEVLIAERVRKRAAWIARQLAEFERYRPRTPPRQYMSGESHLYLGRQYRLKLVSAEAPAVKLSRNQLAVSLPGKQDPARVKALLRCWYLERARAVFSDLLDTCLLHFKDSSCPRLIVRTMQSRWGSLSRAGTITLNANLIRAPRPCIEYVVTRELCHFKHRNHNTEFFRLLGQLMPDWERRKQRLEAALL